MIFESVLALGGLAISAYSAVNSFNEAQKQEELMKQAQADAQAAMNAAKNKLDINYYKQLAVQKEPFRLASEAAISSGAQAIQAGVESERGAAATAGRIQMAQTEAQGDIRTAMGKELTDLAKLTAGEESRLRDEKVKIDLGEVRGQQLMMKDAQEAQAQAITQGFSSLSSFAGQAAQLAPLYSKTRTKTETAVPETMTSITPTSVGGTTTTSELYKSTPPSIGGYDMKVVANMSPEEYKDWFSKISPEEKAQLSSYINPFAY